MVVYWFLIVTSKYDINLLTSLDGGYIHQGCWGWGRNVAGTAVSSVSTTRVAVGPGTHHEVTYLPQLGSPAMRMLYNDIILLSTVVLLYHSIGIRISAIRGKIK